MANWAELAGRLAALKETGLRVRWQSGRASTSWMTLALVDCDVWVCSAKSRPADDAICLVRLKDLERFVAGGATAAAENNHSLPQVLEKFDAGT